jgi:hypothetical protein
MVVMGALRFAHPIAALAENAGREGIRAEFECVVACLAAVIPWQ